MTHVRARASPSVAPPLRKLAATAARAAGSDSETAGISTTTKEETGTVEGAEFGAVWGGYLRAL